MDVTGIRSDREAQRLTTHNLRAISKVAATWKNKDSDDSFHDEKARDVSDQVSLTLLPEEENRPEDRQSILPVEAFTGKDITGSTSVQVQNIAGVDTIEIKGISFSSRTNTQSINNLYSIGKISLDAFEYVVGKYQEAQAYRPAAITTLETYA